MRYPLLAIAASALLAGNLLAQTPANETLPVDMITPEAIARHIGVLAHDSMQGRATPSLGLERTAQYVAAQFHQLGLRPGVIIRPSHGPRRVKADTSWFDRYPLPGNLRLDNARSGVTFGIMSASERFSLDFGTAAWLVGDTILESGGRDGERPQKTVVISGRHTPASLREADLWNTMVLYIPPTGVDSATRQQVIAQLRTANEVLVLSDEDSSTFSARHYVALRRPPVVIDQYMEKAQSRLGGDRWVVYARPTTALQTVLGADSVDLAQLRADSTPRVRKLAKTWIMLQPVFAKHDTATAVNVMGILEGRGPKFKKTDAAFQFSYELQEAIVIMAHMDHRGAPSSGADSLSNGADDNASGVAGLLELAKAFSRPGARPRRSIIFLATSGSAPGFWGSYWVVHRSGRGGDGVVAGVNLDMIGRAAGDSIRVGGLNDFDSMPRPNWIAALHPELRLTAVDGGSISSPQSDHIAFIRAALPMLYVHNGTHGNEAQGPPVVLDAEQQARILRLVYYVGHELASAEQRPRWTSAARQLWSLLFGK